MSASVIEAPPTELLVRLDGLQHALLRNISWERYEQLLSILDGTHFRLTYDEGRLEIMPQLPIHEWVKEVTNAIVGAYAMERDIEYRPLGSTTFRRQILSRGLEPDQCYYVANSSVLDFKKPLDLEIDPPPDLVIEIENATKMIEKLPIYSSLGIPEVWRYDGNQMHYLILKRSGKFVTAAASLSFPGLPLDELNRFIKMGLTGPHMRMVKAVHKWAHSQK